MTLNKSRISCLGFNWCPFLAFQIQFHVRKAERKFWNVFEKHLVQGILMPYNMRMPSQPIFTKNQHLISWFRWVMSPFTKKHPSKCKQSHFKIALCRLLCTFWIKLKYSCMCACVSVWARLHVYPFLVRVYICESLGWSGTVRKEVCMLGCILLRAAMHVQHFVLFLSLSFFARWCTQPCRLTRLPK